MKMVLVLTLALVLFFASLQGVVGVELPPFDTYETIKKVSEVAPPQLVFTRQSEREIVELTWNPVFKDLYDGHQYTDGSFWESTKYGWQNLIKTFENVWFNVKAVVNEFFSVTSDLGNNILRGLENVAYKVVDIATFAGHGAVYLFDIIKVLFRFEEWTFASQGVHF